MGEKLSVSPLLQLGARSVAHFTSVLSQTVDNCDTTDAVMAAVELDAKEMFGAGAACFDWVL